MTSSIEEKIKLIDQHVHTNEGRRKLAQMTIAPFRRGEMLSSICPICGSIVYDLIRHAVNIGDDEHKIMEVMDS